MPLLSHNFEYLEHTIRVDLFLLCKVEIYLDEQLTCTSRGRERIAVHELQINDKPHTLTLEMKGLFKKGSYMYLKENSEERIRFLIKYNQNQNNYILPIVLGLIITCVIIALDLEINNYLPYLIAFGVIYGIYEIIMSIKSLSFSVTEVKP